MVHLSINRQSGVPIYRQLIEQIWAGIASEDLPAGSQLPTVRSVAVDLAINPNTVAKAYRELEIQGVLATQQGTGTFVAERPAQPRNIDRDRELDELCSAWLARAAERGFTARQVVDWFEEKRKES